MSEGFLAFEEKMRAAEMGDAAVSAFRRNYEAFVAQETGLIGESEIEGVRDLPNLEEISHEVDASLLGQTVVIKLNGGLGTSMGLQGPKSLLPVRDGKTFLDFILQQLLSLRAEYGEEVRLLLMNSFSTSEATLEFLTKRNDADLWKGVELMQNQVPKIDAESLAPAVCEGSRELEWCPPGHGDLYTALVESGKLAELLAAGVRYAFVSNADNLGATLNPAILTYVAREKLPFLMEVTRRTGADRKGGHLALRKRDGQLLLREVAQCAEEDLEQFQDIERYSYFNTNSLWIDLRALDALLSAQGGSLPLPMIRNVKTLDPRDKSSCKVVQLETAMGAAIECFVGAAALEVPRTRFAPVKTTGDLFALRSDAYEVAQNGQISLAEDREGLPPLIQLGSEYQLVDRLEELGPVPSLLACGELVVQGRVTFEEGVVLVGDVSFTNPNAKICCEIPADVYEDEDIAFETPEAEL